MTRPRPARPTRRDRADAAVWALQTLRLEAVARGEAAPDCPREEAWSRMRRAGLDVRLDDFVLSRPLWLLERRTLGLPDGTAADGNPLPGHGERAG